MKPVLKIRLTAASLAVALTTLSLVAVSVPAHARTAGLTSVEGLSFVAATDMEDSKGNPLSLCLLTDTQTSFFVNVGRAARGYVLAPHACATTTHYNFPASALVAAKAEGAVPAHVPAEPQLTLAQIIAGSWGIGLAGAFGCAFLMAVLGRFSRRRGTALPEPAQG